MLAAVLGAAPLQGQVDTARPPLPPTFRFRQDTTLLAMSPQDSTVRYYRNIVVIRFQDSVSGVGVRQLFTQYEAVVIGGLPEWPAYVVRVPDPGPTFRTLDSLVSKITHEPRVRLAYPITFDGAYNPQSVLQPSPAVADTVVPPIPAVMTFPQDSTRIVRAPDDTIVEYYRTIAAVAFQDTVSAATIRSFLRRHHVRIVGGLPYSRAYVVQFADPGPDWKRFESIILSMNAEPTVEYAVWLTRRDAPPVIYSPRRSDIPASAPSADTSRPVLPSTFVFPCDTSLFAVSPSDTVVRYYRNIVGIRFDDTTSGTAVRNLLRRYRAEIVGGLPGAHAYIVRVPDPGSTFPALDSLVSRLTHEPGVRFAFGVTFRDDYAPQTRFPNDGPGLERAARPETASRGARPSGSGE